jgi:hypothetical protein
MFAASLALSLTALSDASAEMNIRGFHLGMTVQEADKMMQREFGTRLRLGLAEGASFFIPGSSCGVTGYTDPPNAEQMRQVLKLPGVETYNLLEKPPPLLILPDPATEILGQLRVINLSFDKCAFGVGDDELFDTYSASHPVSRACFDFVRDENGNEVAWCHADDAIVRFTRHKDSSRTTVDLSEPDANFFSAEALPKSGGQPGREQ